MMDNHYTGYNQNGGHYPPYDHQHQQQLYYPGQHPPPQQQPQYQQPLQPYPHPHPPPHPHPHPHPPQYQHQHQHQQPPYPPHPHHQPHLHPPHQSHTHMPPPPHNYHPHQDQLQAEPPYNYHQHQPPPQDQLQHQHQDQLQTEPPHNYHQNQHQDQLQTEPPHNYNQHQHQDQLQTEPPHNYHQHQHQHQDPLQNERYSNYKPNDQNGGQNNMFNGGRFKSGGGNYGRKRRFHNSAQGPAPDPNDGASATKLFVAPVSRTSTEEDIRSVFEEHGTIVEVVLPKEKKTGERAGYCFVKYKTFGECDKAISALQDQYTFPGEKNPIRVRYAAGRERETFGQPVPEKLYVGGLTKQSSKEDIHEVFSPFGLVEDIYVVVDEMKQSRGCAFVRFSRREMALAAIEALNGIFIQRGCIQPLTVRFATPKKLKTGEPRNDTSFGYQRNGPGSQEPAVRRAPNASFSMQQFSSNSHQQTIFHLPNQEVGFSNNMQQLHPPPSSSTQIQQQSSQSVEQAAKVVPLHEKLEDQQKSQAIGREAVNDPSTVAIALTTASQDPPTTNSLLECDWSEHTCPDGDKYYYNCITLESLWEKPEEFARFEKYLCKLKQQMLSNPSHEFCPPVLDCSSQQAEEPRQEYHDIMEVHSETSSAAESTCAQELSGMPKIEAEIAKAVQA